jgi:hypothetical protein
MAGKTAGKLLQQAGAFICTLKTAYVKFIILEKASVKDRGTGI